MEDLIDSVYGHQEEPKKVYHRISAAAPTDFVTSGKKLTLADAIPSEFTHLRKATATLQRQKKANVPLERRQNEKMTIASAKNIAHRQVSRWNVTVAQNRRAEHLKFPLNEPPPKNLTTASLAGSFTPETSLESQVQQVIQSSGLAEEHVLRREELMLNQISKEELMERRAEIAKMKSLLFFKEMKQKKMAKIKSKKYRKIKRKGKKEELDPEEEEEERLKLETQRIQERMTLKHKNTSKWAKRLLGQEEIDTESRRAINEQLKRHEDLKKKIMGASDSEEIEDVEESELIDQMKQEVEESQVPTKGIFAMKFMQRAVENQKYDTLKALNRLEEESDAESEDASEVSVKLDAPISKIPLEEDPALVKKFEDKFFDSARVGEMNFYNDATIVKMSDSIEIQGNSESSIALSKENFFEGQANLSIDPEEEEIKLNVSDTEPIEEENPWLANSGKGPVQKRQADQAFKSQKQESLQERSLKKIKKARKEQQTSQETQKVTIVNQTIPDSSEDETEKSIPKLTNRQILEMAFSADQIFEEDFNEEKEAAIQADAPQEIDATMPGWGIWGGENLAVPERKQIIKKSGIELEQRADRQLKHVIINPKQTKKALKYVLSVVPHGFENRDQYEKTILRPLGQEWNPVKSFQKGIQPRIQVKAGKVITPLQLPKFKK
jgi:U3 small nucleolar RNA-associated protein 14